VKLIANISIFSATGQEGAILSEWRNHQYNRRFNVYRPIYGRMAGRVGITTIISSNAAYFLLLFVTQACQVQDSYSSRFQNRLS
jgi:hypothetical protein